MTNPTNRNTINDFYKRIKKLSSGCHEFQSWSDKDGYRFFRFEGKEWKAHRLSAKIAGMQIENKLVCHRCDNPSCVNPEHLFVGTIVDNNLDRTQKGRSRGRFSNLKENNLIHAIPRSNGKFI